MNPNIERLHEYAFQKLAALFSGIEPDARLAPINLGIGEPRHATPQFIRDTLAQNLAGLANYPVTLGSDALRAAIAAWVARRFNVALDAKTQIIPVNGTREALFAIAQAVVDNSREGPRAPPVVVSPNPFYQIYEGAALLAGAQPFYLNTIAQKTYALDFAQLPADVWRRTQLIYVCSPGNPTGRVMPLAEWRRLFELADEHDFVIASDECYSEIYFDEGSAPLGSLQAAQQLGRAGCARLILFSSLSKRSNVPGMRSGFVAGDAALLKKFLSYRTYHGCAMSPPIQAASIAAWQDEAHVVENRRLYREKFAAVLPILQPALPVEMPEAGFYLWAESPKAAGGSGMADAAFAQHLYRNYNVTVLPGSYLARDAHGMNPGAERVRIALVAPLAECVEAARRIAAFCRSL
ncbi:MAG: succinyldiaminopimelate transaminase [Pseudomonadota bacterium]|nr:succinyldiaminopimelate transaminase [Burkholderiales bacterium]MDQ3196352.1 succinyldiaminopimelate transaminase [Pseudomonadota bacterium]